MPPHRQRTAHQKLNDGNAVGVRQLAAALEVSHCESGGKQIAGILLLDSLFGPHLLEKHQDWTSCLSDLTADNFWEHWVPGPQLGRFPPARVGTCPSCLWNGSIQKANFRRCRSGFGTTIYPSRNFCGRSKTSKLMAYMHSSSTREPGFPGVSAG